MNTKRAFLFLLTFFVFAASLPLAVSTTVHAQKVNDVDFNQKRYTFTAAAGNSFTAGQLGYVNSSGQVALSNALNPTTASGLVVMATETIAGGAAGTFRVLEGEYVTSGLTPGATYYMSDTSGGITATAPTAEGAAKRVVGVALSSTRLYFGPNNSALTVNVGGGGGGTGGGTGGGGGSTGGTPTSPAVESFASTFSTSTTLTNTPPADIVSGELLFSVASTDLLTANGNNTYTKPTDFVDLVPFQRANAAGDGVSLQAWYKIAAGETGNYTIGQSITGRVSASGMLRISGLETTATAIDNYGCSTGTAEPVVAPSVAVSTDDSLVLTVYSWDQGKTLVVPPADVTQLIHNDQSGHDLWIGSNLQAVSGASPTRTVDISSNGPWIACTIALKEVGATSTPDGGGGGGGGTGTGEGAGPFSLADDGTGNPIKITLPIACNGTFVGSACEIFPSNYTVKWVTGDPDLLTYEHPTYFLRNPDYYTFCAPNTGATTTNASNGRSELRYLANVSTGHISRQFVFRVPSGAMANLAQANIGQIHRNPGSPIFKGTYTHKTDGTGFYRILYKNVDGQSGDTAWNMGLGDKILINSIAPGDYIRVKYDYDIAAQTMSFWASNDEGTFVETELTGSPLVTMTGIILGNPSAYSKLGMYMNNAGDGLNTTPMCVQTYQDIYTGP